MFIVDLTAAYLIFLLIRLHNSLPFYMVELQRRTYQYCVASLGKTEGVLPKDVAHLEELRKWYPIAGRHDPQLPGLLRNTSEEVAFWRADQEECLQP